MREDSRRWIEADRSHCWHPFTRQAEWCRVDPLIIVRGEGVWLWDSEGNRYLDGNSSIWTNLHGHHHPKLDAAIRAQLDQVAHTSFLGYGNPRASELAERLCGFFPEGSLQRVFFSDDGSTAIECAVRMALQYRINRREARTRFIAFENGYHGDTLGAASLSGVGRFTSTIGRFGLDVTRVAALEDLERLSAETISDVAAVIIEPLIQGVNEMRPWPSGMLAALRRWCDAHGIHLILDEVMTGFGRTGTMFACQREAVIPDFLCLAKGLTGGYLPLAATLTTGRIYDAFLGGADQAFYYGHSYTANPLGCAVALANLEIFKTEQTLKNLQPKIERLTSLLSGLAAGHPEIHEVRQCGFVAGIELRRSDGTQFPAAERIGEAVCLAARSHGLLTRPILDTIVVMPPLAISIGDLERLVAAIHLAIHDCFGT
jgi:adenosylmethionine---8-amino-7-oxononanoate aminotransferase